MESRLIEDLVRRAHREEPPSWNAGNSGRTVLLTGAGGSIGSALAKTIAKSQPRLLILLDRSEQNLRQIDAELAKTTREALRIAIRGDICDGPLLADIFRKHGADLVYHAAAFKHVPLMETDPVAAVRNNVIGTWNLAKTAVQYGAKTLVMISTDKAVNPRSVMGASKRIAELALLRLSNPRSQMKIVRLGNVYGSSGSVAPLFLEQISQGGPVTVTDPLVSRYFHTIGEAVKLVLAAAALPGSVFVPVVDEPVNVLALAKHLIQRAGFEAGETMPILFTGLRPGDKMSEEFISAGESVESTADGKLRRVNSPGMAPEEFDAAMRELEESIDRSALLELLDVLCRMVPEYRPSETLLGLLSRALA